MFIDRFQPSLEEIRLSPIVSISEEVRSRAPEFEKDGRPFVRLQRGEIDFPTPPFIVEAAKEGLDRGLTKYPKSGGEPFLKDAILARLERRYGATGLGRENVVVTHGGQEGLELSFKLFRSGAGFSPTWSCALEDFVPYAQIPFTQVPLNADFSVDYDRLRAAVRDVEFFYLNNPQNPTGKVFRREELDEIVRICTENECWIVSDEAYEDLVYDGAEHVSLAGYDQENIIAVFTLSKSFSMTGWRIGYTVTRNAHVAGLLLLGDYTQTAGVPAFLQHAAAVALSDNEAATEALATMKEEFDARRHALYDGLSGLSGVKLARPDGAFYLFPDFSERIPPELTGEERQRHVYERLMEEGVASVYGSCFGNHFADNVRLSFSAVTVPQIEIAVERIRKLFG